MAKIKVGLALGGGGARGFAHVGVIKALEEAGFEIVQISGISIGAIIGAGYAHKKDIAHVEQSVLDFEYAKYITPHRSSILLNLDKIIAYFDEHLEHARFSDLEVPLKILTTDLRDMQGFILESGKVATAMAASSSAPYIHKPIMHEGHHLVDGGLISDIPVELADGPDVDLIVGVRVSQPHRFTEADYVHLSSFQKRILGAAPVLSLLWYKQFQKYFRHSQSIISNELSKYRLSSLRKPLLLIEPDLHTIDTLAFDKAKQAMDAGYRDAAETLKQYSLPVNTQESLPATLVA